MSHCRQRMLMALVLISIALGSLSGCSALIRQEAPATWEPLPTLGPKPTATPEPATATPDVPSATATPEPTAVPTPRPTNTQSPEESAAERTLSAAWARDRVWAFLVKTAGEPDLPMEPEWESAREETLLGSTNYIYRAEPWEVLVAVPVLPPDKMLYQVSVEAPERMGWEGQVHPDGSIETTAVTTPTPAPVLVEGWRITLHSLPAGSEHDDFARVVDDSDGQHGIQAPDAEIEARLMALRDGGRVVQVWGTLLENVDDYDNTRIVVQRIAVEAPPATPVPESVLVEGWIGMIYGSQPGAAYDDYFVGQPPAGTHGIASPIPAIENQLAALRNSGTLVRVWGKLDYGVSDYEQTRIVVTLLEIVE